jgi:hydrogenase nickel incorporation protein HypA/HybF
VNHSLESTAVHELSVAESIIDIIEQAVDEPQPIERATVVMGPFAGINAESLKFFFPEAAEARGFGRPELVVQAVPARVHCTECDEDYETDDVARGCPRCGGLQREVLSGREFTLESVEVAVNE